MKSLLTTTAAIAILAASTAHAEAVDQHAIVITHQDAQTSFQGTADHFTGNVGVKLMFQPQAPARTSAGLVNFAPGARTTWHTHPLGQTLIVTEGKGWIQEWGSAKREIQPGDVVWIPPGVKHWHGGTSTLAMSHIAIQEALDGQVVEWLEQVPETVYAQ